MYMHIALGKCDYNEKCHPFQQEWLQTGTKMIEASISFHTWKPFFFKNWSYKSNAENVLLKFINISPS